MFLHIQQRRVIALILLLCAIGLVACGGSNEEEPSIRLEEPVASATEVPVWDDTDESYSPVDANDDTEAAEESYESNEVAEVVAVEPELRAEADNSAEMEAPIPEADMSYEAAEEAAAAPEACCGGGGGVGSAPDQQAESVPAWEPDQKADAPDAPNWDWTEPIPIVPPNRDPNPDGMVLDGDTVNPFVDTRDDKLSTFAIDVDTASYTVMRNYLLDYGSLPSPESVRVEEYVNFFDYDYPRPETGAFAIHAEGSTAPYGESEAYQLARIGIQGYEVPAEDRTNALLIFVIDVSGSMEGSDRLGLVKDSLRLLVDNLKDEDRVGIVVYGSNARTVLDPTPVSSAEEIQTAIRNLRTEGATNADAGIQMAYRLADKYRLDGEITRLIVLSDGVANVGATTADEVLEYARRNISLSTFGFGMGTYNDVFMEGLANSGDGTYGYIDSLREAQRLFVTDLNSTLMTIAKDAKIQVEFNPEVVETYRLIGYENRDVADQDFRNDTVDAGEIGAGHSVTALYELRLKDDASPDDPAFTTRVRYEEPETGSIKEISQETMVSALTGAFTSGSDSFQLAGIVAEYAELLRESYWAREGSYQLVWQDADRISRAYPEANDVQEFTDLVESATSYYGASR